MKLAKYIPESGWVFFSNEDLQVGDETFTLVWGYTPNQEHFVTDIRWQDYDPRDPHIILDLNHSPSKSHEVRTNHGYGPKESYFKIIQP